MMAAHPVNPPALLICGQSRVIKAKNYTTLCLVTARGTATGWNNPRGASQLAQAPTGILARRDKVYPLPFLSIPALTPFFPSLPLPPALFTQPFLLHCDRHLGPAIDWGSAGALPKQPRLQSQFTFWAGEGLLWQRFWFFLYELKCCN